MKNVCVLILLGCLTFCVAESHSSLTVVGPTVSAYTEALANHEFYTIETYEWDSKTKKYELLNRTSAGFALCTKAHCAAVGKGYFSIFAKGDLYAHTVRHPPPTAKPTHTGALRGESDTGIKVGSGWPIIIFSGLKSAAVTARGELKTTLTTQFDLVGQGKVDTRAGGGSASAGPVGGGSSASTGSTGWIKDTCTFRPFVVEIRPARPESEGVYGRTVRFGNRTCRGWENRSYLFRLL